MKNKQNISRAPQRQWNKIALVIYPLAAAILWGTAWQAGKDSSRSGNDTVGSSEPKTKHHARESKPPSAAHSVETIPESISRRLGDFAFAANLLSESDDPIERQQTAYWVALLNMKEFPGQTYAFLRQHAPILLSDQALLLEMLSSERLSWAEKAAILADTPKGQARRFGIEELVTRIAELAEPERRKALADALATPGFSDLDRRAMLGFHGHVLAHTKPAVAVGFFSEHAGDPDLFHPESFLLAGRNLVKGMGFEKAAETINSVAAEHARQLMLRGMVSADNGAHAHLAWDLALEQFQTGADNGELIMRTMNYWLSYDHDEAYRRLLSSQLDSRQIGAVLVNSYSSLLRNRERQALDLLTDPRIDAHTRNSLGESASNLLALGGRYPEALAVAYGITDADDRRDALGAIGMLGAASGHGALYEVVKSGSGRDNDTIILGMVSRLQGDITSFTSLPELIDHISDPDLQMETLRGWYFSEDQDPIASGIMLQAQIEWERNHPELYQHILKLSNTPQP